MADDRITRQIVEYYTNLKYEDLPADVVHTVKRIFMDIVGCALGSHPLDKGANALKIVRAKGGTPEASILGTGEKFPMDEVAFANGELMHSMDFNAISPPLYVAPFLCPAALAVAENKGASGEAFIAAMVSGFETAMRVGQSLGNFRSREIKTRASGTSWDTMGVAIAAGKLMGFDKEKMTHAFGLSGYFAPVPCLMKYMHTANNGMMKFGAAGWTAKAGITAAELADIGEYGDYALLDGEYGFWAMAGAPMCNFDFIVADLGTDWKIRESNKFKSLPCDGHNQGPLWVLMDLMNKHNIKTEEIEHINIKAEENIFFEQYMSHKIENNVDASMSFPYAVAVVAHRIPIGPHWQLRETYTNPAIIDFMDNKVSFESYDYANKMRDEELKTMSYINTRPSVVEVTARGQVFTGKGEYAKWLSDKTPETYASDEDLIKKFHANVADVMTVEQAEKAVDALMNLEKVGNVKDLIKILTW